MNAPDPSMFSRVCRSHGTGVMAGQTLQDERHLEFLQRVKAMLEREIEATKVAIASRNESVARLEKE